MSNSKILFFMSGSVAAFKACHVLSRLKQDGHEVQVVATPSTFNFVGAATLEGLSGRKVLSSLWETGHAMDHIHLTRWADFALLCPASANTIARLAHGLADDLVSAMALAWPSGKPFLLTPAMNSQMLSAAVTKQNLDILAARGLQIAGTQSGPLACGEYGEGRMLEAEEILRLLPTRPVLGRVLVTAGATREPLDGIRYLSNVSTGQTGSALADQLYVRGWQVTFLGGTGSATPNLVRDLRTYRDFKDLDHQLRAELMAHSYIGVVHGAAVADFSLENPQPEVKISSARRELTLKLKANYKILPRLKEYSRTKDIAVVGFKLTFNQSAERTIVAAREILKPGAVDAVIANDWSQVHGDREKHPGFLITATSDPVAFADLPALTDSLHQLLHRRPS